MKNKKKNVFLAGLMVLMMIVSLLSGMNLSVAKAAAVVDPNKMISFTIIKKWDSTPVDGVKVKFNIYGKAGSELLNSDIVLPVKEKEGYNNTVITYDQDGGQTWTTKVEANKYYRGSIQMEYSIEEAPSKIYTSSTHGPQTVNDGATVTFVNTVVKKKLTIKKIWNEGDEKTGTKLTLTANGKDAGEILLYKRNDWTHGIDLPVYDSAGNPIEYAVTEKKIGDDNTKVTKEVKLVDDNDKPADKELIFDNSSINIGNIQVTNTWVGTVGQASFGLFKKGGTDKLNYTVKVENAGTPDKFTVKFENVSLADEYGNAVQYEINELDANNKIVASGDAVTLNNRNYRVSYDEKGNITNTEIINGGNVVPVIPSTPVVPETTPLVPVTTPTVPETTPVVTVPDDTTPQGDVNTSNENKKTTPSDENTDDNDGVVDVDEDKVPEGAAKVKNDTSKEVPVNVDEDSTPKGTANLPKTGGTVGGLLSILGMGLLALGLAVRKRK